ncbi:MAG: UbiA family prenyltransferase [Candidatus Heimdallarchaeaceae archaeon]
MTNTSFSRREIILSYITILRLVNGIVAGLAATFGVVLSLPDESLKVDYVTLILIVLAAMFVSSQAMIFNDIIDRKEDEVNAPHRPIPSGKISVKTAKIYGTIIALIALFLALAIDIKDNLCGLSIATAFVFGGLLDLYNLKLKKMGFIGNTIIGINVIALFVYGSLHTFLSHPETSFKWVPILVGTAAGLGNIGREVIKGLPDIEGDRKAGVKTLAVKYGAKKAAIVGSLLLWGLVIGALIAIIVPQVLGYPSALYLPSQIIGYILAASGAFLAIAIIFNQNPKWAYTTKEILLLIFLFFLLDFIIDKIIKIALS